MAIAIPTKDTQFWIETAVVHNTFSVTVTPTAISKAAPAVVTCVGSTAVPGQLVYATGTGFSELDNKYFMVGTASTATSLVLTGSDTTGSLGTIGTTPKLSVAVQGTDVVPICPSSLSFDAGAATSVGVATFCDPRAVITGTPSDGTATFAGYVSPEDKGYRQLMTAAKSGRTLVIYIKVPPVPGKTTTSATTGMVVLEGVVSTYTETYEIGQAIAWTSGLNLTGASRQIWQIPEAAYVAPPPI